jgi:hypothetical protein
MVWRGSDLFPSLSLAFHLDSLTKWNEFLMRMFALPPLYSTSVEYIGDTVDTEHPENWLDCLEVLARGGADCKSLATYRTAELRVRGNEPQAKAAFHRRVITPPGGRPPFVLAHIFVERQDGRLEDPSRILGMPT